MLTPPYYRIASVSLTIGGRPAKILDAGAAPNRVSGVLQVNAVVPDGIGSGAQPAMLTIEKSDNTQQAVTVADASPHGGRARARLACEAPTGGGRGWLACVV